MTTLEIALVIASLVRRKIFAFFYLFALSYNITYALDAFLITAELLILIVVRLFSFFSSFSHHHRHHHHHHHRTIQHLARCRWKIPLVENFLIVLDTLLARVKIVNCFFYDK